MADFDFTQLKGRMAQAGRAGHVDLTDMERNVLITNAMDGGGGSEVDTDSIVDGAVTSPKIADSSVTTRKLSNGSITIEKFAEKEYAPESFSGLGQKYLRKNISGDKNVLTSAMVSDANTIYHIQYDYDLNGQTITLPAGCILEFEGGSLSNGKLIGNRTYINANGSNFLDNVVLQGTWKNISFALEWWKVYPYDASNQIDNTDNIKKAISSASAVRSLTLKGIYGISSPINIATVKIESHEITNYRSCGFRANDNFEGATVTISNTDYAVSGMFYFYTSQNPVLERIMIDANFKADYCIQHITGYAGADINFVELYKAKVVGILQYGCERPTWSCLRTSQCNIGAFISTHEFDSTKFPTYKGTSSKGMPNLVNLKGCRFCDGNIGIIIIGGSNTSLHDCETAGNSLWGIVTDGANLLLDNYYSERDGVANFHLYPDGTKEYNSTGNSYTNDYLIENNMDGVASLGPEETVFSAVAYMRSIILAYSSNIKIIKGFYSFTPRSHRSEDSEADLIIEPTERATAGIDAIIILKDTLLCDETSKLYCHTMNSGSYKPWICVYNLADSTAIEREIILGGGMTTYGIQGTTTYYDNYKVGSDAKTFGCKYRGGRFNDLNVEINTRRYGLSTNSRPMNMHKIKGEYQGMPLYKRDTNVTQRTFISLSKSKITELFGDRKFIKARVVVYLPATATTRFICSYRYMNSSYALVQSGFSTDTGNVRSQTAGYYDFVFPIRLVMQSAEWAYLWIQTNIDNESTIEAYISDIYLYDICGPEMRVPFIQYPTIQSGITNYRPYLPDKGQRYYDTTLSKWIEYNGSAWVNIDGTALS